MIPIGKKYHTTKRREDGCEIIRLYNTDIATLGCDGVVTLHTGGFNTATTRRRMNQCLETWGHKERVSKSTFAYTDTVHLEPQ
jgi:hypothetical protein